MSQTEQIKSHIDIVELVSEYVRLRQSGSNWKGLCPFHREKTPSFLVSKDKQIFKCFGCGAAGDVFEFLMKMEGLDFSESLKVLAQRAGIKLERHDFSDSSKKNIFIDICHAARDFWNEILTDSEEGKNALAYLKGRGVDEKQIQEFNLGYAPDSWDRTLQFLQKKGYATEDIFSAGLIVKKEKGSGFYDRFRNRIIFPIQDIHGSTIAFGGRIFGNTKDTDGAKYVNSPQTQIYNKSAIVYNLDKAKQFIRRAEYSIVVEGYMDVLACFRAGIKNVIASSGTAFTDLQIKVLKRYSENLVLCFDADLAGQEAASRGIDLALAQDMNIKVITLKDGKDPDEVISKNPKDFIEAIQKAQTIMDYFFGKLLARYNVNDSFGQKKIKNALLPVIGKISDPVVQSFWIKHLAKVLDVSDLILHEEFKKYLFTSRPKLLNKELEKSSVEPLEIKSRKDLLEERILSLLLKFPENVEIVLESLGEEIITHPTMFELYRKVNIYYTLHISEKVAEFDIQGFRNFLETSGKQFAYSIDSLLMLAEKDFEQFSKDNIRLEVLKSISALKHTYYQLRLSEVIKSLRQAEIEKNISKIEELSQEVNQIYKEKNLLHQHSDDF